jgi:DNA (cytosine-5)-methyltransferase 1
MRVKPKLLDLFCCTGSGSEGYADAGFEVTGVEIDLKCEKHYPYKFINGDVLTLDVDFIKQFDLVSASPPCQSFSLLKHRTGKEYPNLIPQTRELLIESGVDYIIENVEQAKDDLKNPVTLCGTNFDLGTNCKDGVYRQLWRHRVFEANFDIESPGPCKHQGQPIGVFGDGGGGQMTRGYKAYASEGIEAMGIKHYTPRKYVSQGIPPAFTYYLSQQWLLNK